MEMAYTKCFKISILEFCALSSEFARLPKFLVFLVLSYRSITCEYTRGRSMAVSNSRCLGEII